MEGSPLQAALHLVQIKLQLLNCYIKMDILISRFSLVQNENVDISNVSTLAFFRIGWYTKEKVLGSNFWAF